MKVLHVNTSDIEGGAARAAYRLHKALLQAGVESSMLVSYKSTDDWRVLRPFNLWQRGYNIFKHALMRWLLNSLNLPATGTRSLSVLPSRVARIINASDADVVHLHWVNNEMMSIADIGKIKKPVVWTFHDMWAFSGSEHYPVTDHWKDSYKNANAERTPPPAIDRWLWKKKWRTWVKPMHIVAPSQWMGDCVKQSSLMKTWPVSVIPNAIDTDVWKPRDQTLAREVLGLPQNVPLVLFGAIGGGADPRKGYDLLQQATAALAEQNVEFELAVFGQSEPKEAEQLNTKVHYMGHLHDDASLQLLYSAANCLVIPSRQDNLPNTGVEAAACGAPVVAFDVGGLKSVVNDGESGFLAAAYSPAELAAAIAKTLSKDSASQLKQQARHKALINNANLIVASQHIELYKNLRS